MKWHGIEDFDPEEFERITLQAIRDYSRDIGAKVATLRGALTPEEREEEADLIAQAFSLPTTLYRVPRQSFDYGYTRTMLARLARAYCAQRFPKATIFSSNEETRYDAEADQWGFVFYRDYYALFNAPNSSGKRDPRVQLIYGWQPPHGWQLLATDCDPTPAWARDEREGEYGDPSRYD